MNADQLEELVLTANNYMMLARAFSGLDAKQRAALSSSAQSLRRQLYANKVAGTASERLKVMLSKRTGQEWDYWHSIENRNASLALFAVGPLSAVKQSRVQIWRDQLPALDLIIRDRKPDWIDAWVDQQVENGFGPLDFPTLYRWVSDGICQKPGNDRYYQLFAGYLARIKDFNRPEDYVPPISEQLLAAPELLGDIDGLFRVETGAFLNPLWRPHNQPDDYENWTQALIKLAEGKHLDRGHLLNLALSALRLDFKQNYMAGYHKFYCAMAPTIDELIDHQAQFVDLLCHPMGHVAKFAIDMLAKVDKAKKLAREPFLREIGTVFASPLKGNAQAALKLVKPMIGPANKAPDATAVAVVINAVGHAVPEVQSTALEILLPWKDHLTGAHRAALDDVSALVSPSNHATFERLLATKGSIGAESVPDQTTRAPSLETLTYQPLPFAHGCDGVLAGSQPIVPIDTVDALIDAAFHAIEVVDSPDEIERIIDAVSRLADQRPPDFDQRVAPLLHRLQKGGGGRNGLGIAGFGIGLVVIDLLATWASGRLFQTRNHNGSYTVSQDAFVGMGEHLRTIAWRVTQRSPQQTLSAPTHRGGWIDPLVWLDRLKAVRAIDEVATSMDLRLSMLRLAPDHRAQALQQAGALTGDLGRLARFALGGDDRPKKADQSNYAAWITAARCRDPKADWRVAFAELALEDIWPDSLSPAIHHWTSLGEPVKHAPTGYSHAALKINTSSAIPLVEAPKGGLIKAAVGLLGRRVTTQWEELPTAAFCRRQVVRHWWKSDLRLTWLVQWLGFIWPQNPTSMHIRGAAALAARMDESSTSEAPNHGYLSSLFQKGRPWGEPGHLVLAMGLLGRDADVRGLAIDAFIDGIEGQVFDPAMFAAVMVGLIKGEWVKLNRVSETLLPVIQVSPLHAHAIDTALQAWLPDFDLNQRNSHHVLQVLAETQAITGAPLHPPTHTALSAVSGKTKTATLAKQILG